jgi:hypothetical protein
VLKKGGKEGKREVVIIYGGHIENSHITAEVNQETMLNILSSLSQI